MKRQFRLNPEDAAHLDSLLAYLGFIYEKTECRTRYNIGGFIKEISKAEISVSKDKKYATLRIGLPAQKSQK